MALWARLTGWMMQRGATVNRRPASPKRRSVILRLERLEDRTVPSGGPGTSSTSGGSGSSGGPTAVVSTTTTTPTTTFTINLSAVEQATGPTPLLQLITGYPVAPSCGPGLSGAMLVVTDPSVLASLGGSTVAMMPVTSPSGGGSTTLTLVDTTTGATVNVPVTVVPAPTSSSSGTSGSSGGTGSPSTSGSAPTLPSGSSGSSGSTSGSSGTSAPTTTS